MKEAEVVERPAPAPTGMKAVTTMVSDLLPVCILISIIAGGGYFVNSVVLLKESYQGLATTMGKGFDRIDDTVKTLPMQTLKLAELERRIADAQAALDRAVANGAAQRERLATENRQRDEGQDVAIRDIQRAITDMRQSWALDHADLVRMSSTLQDFVNATNGRLPAGRR